MSTLHLSRGSSQALRPEGIAGAFLGPVILESRRALGRLAIWRARARERRELREMNPVLLHDLGLTAAEVATETAKPFWRA